MPRKSKKGLEQLKEVAEELARKEGLLVNKDEVKFVSCDGGCDDCDTVSEKETHIKTKVYCLAERITTQVGDSYSTESVGYEYNPGTLDGEELVQIHLLDTEGLSRFRNGQAYTKEQLEAHIINLQTILTKFNPDIY